MSQSKRAMPEKITVEMRAEELPDSIKARLQGDGDYVPGMPYRVTVEPVDDLEAKRAALLRDLQVGIDDLEAGRVEDFDVDDFLVEMHAQLAAKKR